MSNKTINEQELRERLKKKGKSNDEIERLLADYVTASESTLPDMKAISELLQQSKQENVLRVRSFNLSNVQYDALINYCADAGLLESGQPITAN